MQKVAADRLLKEDLDAIVKEVEENAYCFSFYSKAYLKNEGIYILRQKFENDKFVSPKDGGYIDTLDLYNVFYDEKDTAFYKDRTMSFSKWPATVDIALKFSFTGQNPKIKRTDTASYDLSQLTDKNFKEVLSNKFKIDEAIDVGFMDELIKKSLKKYKLDTVYQAGIRKEGDADFEYLKAGSTPATLKKAGIKSTFLQNRFDKPYELLVVVPDSFNSIIRAMSVMMLSSAVIILILIFCYAYFVKTILDQKKLSEMKNTFINNITHEFRTPITNIKLALENWHDAPEKSSRYSGIIAEENEHMERNVEQILRLASFEHGCTQAEFTEVDIIRLIHETVNSFEIQLNKVNGEVIYHIEAAETVIYGDRAHLKTLLYNLIDNAIKYSKTNPVITINVLHTKGGIQLEVEDNGIGMSPETQKHIFDRFYRGYTGDTHDVKGFGLGLSYVKYIVELHGGTIKVKSKPGIGSKFTIQLPDK
jgi:two-component system phosphate regulon sensor histidine kinase PhoR